MTRSITIVGIAALSASLLSACSLGQGDPRPRIERILAGLHTRTSIDAVPDTSWTLRERMAHYRVPAVSIAVIHDGEIAWARGYESPAAGELREISDQTLFQAASISKMLTAFATMRVVDEERLALDAPVNRYLHSWTLPDGDAGAADSVTAARLLGHMAGINVPGFPGYAPTGAIPTLQEVLDGAEPANTPPVRITGAPGSSWNYSGGGYLVMQQVLEDVTGDDFASLMDRLVLQPLGMTRSTFRQPLPASLVREAATGHGSDGMELPGRWHIYPEQAVAGLWTTATDLARFILAVQAAATGSPRSLLSDSTAAALTVPRFIGAFSLGLLIRGNGERSWCTFNGGNYGYRALLYGYLTTGEGAVVMTNGDNGLDLANEIINSIALEYRWPGFVPEGLQ